jgi:hypothetical protein
MNRATPQWKTAAQIDPEEEIDLEQIGAIKRFENKRSVAYKTVETFAGLTKKKLWLKDGSVPMTDGHEIQVPFSHPEFYRLTEHELAHILFRSDSKAKGTFVKEYTSRVTEVAEKEGVAIQKPQLQAAIGHMINVLEDHRVESLWELLYAGSAALMKDMAREEIQPHLEHAHESLLTYFSVLEAGMEPGPGEMDRFRPYFEEALRKVHRRGFVATLATAKWLVTGIVTEILREMRNMPPPPPGGMPGGDDEDGDQQDDGQQQPGAAPSMGMHRPDPSAPKRKKQQPQSGDSDDQDSGEGDSQPQKGEGDGESTGDSADGAQEGAEGQSPGDASGGPDGKSKDDQKGGTGGSGKDDEQADGDGGGGGQDETENQEPWDSPKPPEGTSTKDRAEALKEAVRKMGGVPDKLEEKLDDYKESKFAKRGANQEAMKVAQEALKTNVMDDKELKELLDASGVEMDKLVSEAKQALRQEFHEDEWLQKDAMAKVVFNDVKRKDIKYDLVQPLGPEDQQTVQRLRALFHKVMGRKKVSLDDSGTEIDIPAYIAGKVKGLSEPCFKHEEKGQGFKFKILFDMSGSMFGDKYDQTLRACRIIVRALKFPFVEGSVWGFQSHESGQIDVVRFEPGLDEFASGKAHVGGATPLHVAVRLAARDLDKGQETKQMFVLTDGFPVHSRRDGRQFSTTQLMMFTRDEIQSARQDGIGVTGVLIGSRSYGGNMAHWDMTPKQLQFMFGSPKSWKMIQPTRLATDLVQLVATSFVDYLRAR